MGLTAEVGVLRDLRENDPEGAEAVAADLEAIDSLLRARGLATFEEPLDGDWELVSLDLGPYSTLHQLRRLAAYVASGLPLPEPGAGDDSVLQAVYDRLDAGAETPFAHLLNHSDAEGYYVPVDFPSPLLGREIPGIILGSSVALRRELRQIAEALGIPPGLAPESDELWAAREDPGSEGWERYGVESFACVRLLAAAEASVAHHAVLAFA